MIPNTLVSEISTVKLVSTAQNPKIFFSMGYIRFETIVCMILHKIMQPLLIFALVAFAISSLFVVTDAFADIPPWIKQNAGWWADDLISESEFLTGISYLISTNTIVISTYDMPDDDNATVEKEDSVPSWIKQNARWWADDLISDADFLSGIQYLIQVGLITVSTYDTIESDSVSDAENDSVLAKLESDLEECSKITKAYKRIDCEKPLKQAILVHDYKTNADVFSVGPINYYWFGLNTDGNSFEITPSGQALLALRLLAENTSTEIQSLNCTSPSLCNYDVWDGSTAFRYAGTDFTSGQIVLNPDSAREFNILFGPNVGYGGSQFLYDESKEYHFRINESFGSAMIPVDIPN